MKDAMNQPHKQGSNGNAKARAKTTARTVKSKPKTLGACRTSNKKAVS
jgi:hypothetical protein